MPVNRCVNRPTGAARWRMHAYRWRAYAGAARTKKRRSGHADPLIACCANCCADATSCNRQPCVMRDLRASPTTKSGISGASAFSLIPRFPGYLSKSRGEVVRQPKIRVYYWRGVPNFGDVLAAPLLTRFSDVKATWSPIDAAQATTSGSVLEHIPAGWGGFVAGSGGLGDRLWVLDGRA